jgi:hypothetical protein
VSLDDTERAPGSACQRTSRRGAKSRCACRPIIGCVVGVGGVEEKSKIAKTSSKEFTEVKTGKSREEKSVKAK